MDDITEIACMDLSLETDEDLQFVRQVVDKEIKRRELEYAEAIS